MTKICTLHQVLGSDGLPMAHGSEVRLPSGEVIPSVSKVVTQAEAGGRFWETTITLKTQFGEPIQDEPLDPQVVERFRTRACRLDSRGCGDG